MSKRKTVGERIAAMHVCDTDEYIALSRDIDRAIRRAQAKAWDEGWIGGSTKIGLCENPYRWRAKR